MRLRRGILVQFSPRNIQERFQYILNEHQSGKAVYFGIDSGLPRLTSIKAFMIFFIKTRVPYSFKVLAEDKRAKAITVDVVYCTHMTGDSDSETREDDSESDLLVCDIDE